MQTRGNRQHAVTLPRSTVEDAGPMAGWLNWRVRWDAVINRLEPVSADAALDRLLGDAMTRRGPVTMAFVNAHVMNLLVEQPELFSCLRQTDLVLRDGVGVALLLRMAGLAPGLNLNGTDLIPRLLERATDIDIALFGTEEPHLAFAANAIASRHGIRPERITTADGFQRYDHYLAACQRWRPRLVILGMGVPKQEHVAWNLKRDLDHDCLIVCGGAILDFYAGRFLRAPQMIRRLNMEWAYRLWQEPTRLFRRYVIGNPAFLLRAARLYAMSGNLSRRADPYADDNLSGVPTLPVSSVIAGPVPVTSPVSEAERKVREAEKV